MEPSARFVVSRFARPVFSLLILAAARPAPAEVPQVLFDMPYTAACRDVTSPEFKISNPGEKLVEAKLSISTLLQSGREDDLRQFIYRLEGPQRTMQVVDYLPKTAHESLVAGPVGIQNTRENVASIGINLSGHYEHFTGPSVNSGISQKRQSAVKYELLPPLETVTASGTILRGSGVYFKLKASQRNLLEGERQFALVLRVPSSWRADYVAIHCQAEGVQRGIVSQFDQQHFAGQRQFLVALYLEGDAQARAAAENFSRAEANLRSVARVKQRAIEGRAQPTVAHQIGALFAMTSPQIPEDWLARLLIGPPAQGTIPKRLPREVVQAAQEFVSARKQLSQFSG